MTDEQDFTNPDFVLGAVLAQLEELPTDRAVTVLADAFAWYASHYAARPDEPTFPEGATVAVQFSVEMYVHVDLTTGLPTKTIVQTPNVSSMGDIDVFCVRLGDDLPDTPGHPARWGRPATPDEEAEAVKILDANTWPDPELVA